MIEQAQLMIKLMQVAYCAHTSSISCNSNRYVVLLPVLHATALQPCVRRMVVVPLSDCRCTRRATVVVICADCFANAHVRYSHPHICCMLR
jgi:hypothetical protein